MISWVVSLAAAFVIAIGAAFYIWGERRKSIAAFLVSPLLVFGTNLNGSLELMGKIPAALGWFREMTGNGDAASPSPQATKPNLGGSDPPQIIQRERWGPLDRSACESDPIIGPAGDRKTLDFSRSNLIKCLDRMDCGQVAASVCAQARGPVDIAECSRQSLGSLPNSDRRELAVQFEERQCFREALIWILGSRSGDLKPWLARWKRNVCAAGREDLLDDANTQQMFSVFGISNPSYDREIPWRTCVAL
ncbi:hypothetical protein [Rhodopseudomonas palustris]|uniref:Uncharacterized protein n=1 Tax=Rhodopseudomonas palustris (strain BisB18) TaxID=316056 RepID=Q213L1_RHOPB